MPDNLHIAPNKPLYVSLVDPEGSFDFDIGIGQYETTSGQTLQLPRPAVVQLNMLAPRPGEEIQIVKHWSGRPGDSSHWTVALSTRSELLRADAGEPDTLTRQLEASIDQIQNQKAAVAPPTPISSPKKRDPKPETSQPRLFDRGTGTHGPAPAAAPAPLSIPLPAIAIGKPLRPGQIPANVAVKEVLQFINTDPNTANWSDQSRQDLLSTILIAAYKAGHIGLWERG